MASRKCNTNLSYHSGASTCEEISLSDGTKFKTTDDPDRCEVEEESVTESMCTAVGGSYIETTCSEAYNFAMSRLWIMGET